MDGSWLPALVGRRATGGRGDHINGWAAWEQRVSERSAAIVGQWTERDIA